MLARVPPGASCRYGLDLYLQHRPRLLSDSDTEVVELSEVLNALPIHAVRPDAEKFRNPNGVAMKLANFAALDPQYPGAGLRAGGKEDRETWDLFYDRPDDLAMLAGALRRWASKGDAPAAPEEGEDEAEEGRIAYRQHRARERDHSLGKKKKAAALRSNGRLACEVCGFDFSLKYGDIRGRRCTVITATTDPCGQLLALPWPEPMKLLTRQRRSARNPLRRGRRRVR